MLKCQICEKKDADFEDLVCPACYDRINGMIWCSCLDPSPFWICPRCATTESTTATAATASQLAPTTATTTDTAESTSQEVRQLKAEVVELNADIERLKAEAVKLKHDDTNPATKAMPGHTIVVAFTEHEANEMRHIAEKMGSC